MKYINARQSHYFGELMEILITSKCIHYLFTDIIRVNALAYSLTNGKRP